MTMEKIDLLEEVKSVAPESPITGSDDPRILYLMEKYSLSEEEAFQRFENGIGEYYKRTYFTKEYGWSVPNEEAIKEIKDFVEDDECLEIGAGYGLWAKLMQDVGIDIVPTDSFGHRSGWVPEDKSFTYVEDLNSEEALDKYDDANVLMMSWPPYDNPLASDAITAFSGGKLISIGECGGCTADSKFFEILDSQWVNVGNVQIPQWEGIHDYLSLWVRK